MAPDPDVERVVVYCDGGARGNPGPAAIGAVVLTPIGSGSRVLAEISETIGVATNNVAEYKALIAGLEAARGQGAKQVEVRADSELVIRQLQGRYKVRNSTLAPLHRRARALLATFEEVTLVHVLRDENTEADALVNAALDAEAENESGSDDETPADGVEPTRDG